jgi:hypothetical protein
MAANKCENFVQINTNFEVKKRWGDLDRNQEWGETVWQKIIRFDFNEFVLENTWNSLELS